MTISGKVKMLYARTDNGMVEYGISPHNLSVRMKMESLAISIFEDISGAVSATFSRKFNLCNREEI